MSYKIEGSVKEVREAQTFGTFTKRELWLDTEKDSKYPQETVIEFSQNNTALLDPIKAGDEVTVTFDVRGRYHEGTDKRYNSLNGWGIDVKAKSGAPESAPPKDFEESDDQIPF